MTNKLNAELAWAILSEELATVVAKAEKTDGVDTPRAVFKGFAKDWHPDVLRRALRIAAGRFHGQFLASVPVKDGAKAAAFETMWADICAGKVPAELVGGGRAATGKLSDEESVACEIAEAQLLDAARGMIQTGSGKNGRILIADLMTALSGNVKTAQFVRAAGDSLAFDRDAILAHDGLMAAIKPQVDAEMKRRAEMPESVDLAGLGL